MAIMMMSFSISLSVCVAIFQYKRSFALWMVKTANSLCVQVSFCMLAMLFYFVKRVIISCELHSVSPVKGKKEYKFK